MAEGRWLPTAIEASQLLLTFLLTLVAWVFFRARDLSHAFSYLGNLFRAPFFTGLAPGHVQPLVIGGLLLLIEWIQRAKTHPMDVRALPLPIRWSSYLAAILVVLLFGSFGEQQFIYFQF